MKHITLIVLISIGMFALANYRHVEHLAASNTNNS